MAAFTPEQEARLHELVREEVQAILNAPRKPSTAALLPEPNPGRMRVDGSCFYEGLL